MILYYSKRAAQMIRTSGFAFFARSLKFSVLKRLGRLQLMSIFISPSHECNANCVHCYEKFKGITDQGLTTAEVKNIIDQFEALGGLIVHLCSGEFLMRADSIELIRYAADKHMYCGTTTNGLLLNEKMVKNLKRAGLQELVVSLDSANPARHDALRGVPGCFDRAVQGLRLAAAEGIGTVVWTYVSKSNFDELEAITQIAREVGAKHTLVFFTLLSGHFFDRPEENLTPEDRESFRARYNARPDVRLEFQHETEECTGGGKEHVCVMPSGDVTFCPPVPYSYGNIRERPLADCLRDCLADHKRFCVDGKCTGQCIVNFPEYRQNCRAQFMYGDAANSE